MQSLKKVLIISTNPFYGGGESFIANTLKNITGELFFMIASEELEQNINSSNCYTFKTINFISRLSEIKSFIRHNKINTVIFNGGSAIYFSPFIYECEKIIYRHTTNECVENRAKRFLYILILHLCYGFSDKIVHVSKFAMHEQKLFQKRSTYVHHGVIPQPFIKHDYKYPLKFVFIGRCEKAKGIDIIVEAFRKVPKEMAILDVVGTGSLSKWLESINEPNITYHGFSNNVNKFYRNADVFISLPSSEAFGLTIIEAMNNSLPVVVSKVGAIPEIVENDKNGIFVERDILSVEDAINKLCNDMIHIGNMAIDANNLVMNKFNINNTISTISNIIKLSDK